MKYKSKSFSVAETEELGYQLGQNIKGKTFIALYGEMGVGKTALVRGIASGLGVPDGVHSPTFTLVNEYHGHRDIKIYHFDLYRISGEEELYFTGFFDYLAEEAVIITEWSENIKKAIPDNAIKVILTRLSEQEREITVEGRGDT